MWTALHGFCRCLDRLILRVRLKLWCHSRSAVHRLIMKRGSGIRLAVFFNRCRWGSTTSNEWSVMIRCQRATFSARQKLYCIIFIVILDTNDKKLIKKYILKFIFWFLDSITLFFEWNPKILPGWLEYFSAPPNNLLRWSSNNLLRWSLWSHSLRNRKFSRQNQPLTPIHQS